MLISHEHKFITIDIPKTGTRSLRRTLLPLGIIDIVGEPKPPGTCDFSHHGNIKEIISLFGKHGWGDCNKYLKYSVVRNPWNRYFSFFTYYKEKLKFYTDNTAPLNDNQIRQHKNILKIFNGDNDTEALKSLILKFPSQKEYLVDDSNVVMVDQIGQLENIQDSFNEFCQLVKIPKQKLQHENKSKSSVNKSDLFTQELIDMVAEKEKWVIDKFNYDCNFP